MGGKKQSSNKLKVKMTCNCTPDAESTDKIIADHIVSVANLSMQTEKERDNSLKGFAEQLLTCVTILSVAYLTPLQVILDAGKSLGEGWPRTVGFVYLFLLSPLLVALILALVSIDLRKEELLASPVELFSFFNDACERQSFEEEITCLSTAKSYCDSLNNEYKALEHKHERMIRPLKVASGLVIFSVAVATLGLVSLFLSIL